MLTKLFTYLKHEQQLLIQLVSLAEEQQQALVKYNISRLEEVTRFQEEVAASLRNAEEQRINMLMNWLKISRAKAIGLKLSAVEKYFKDEELLEIRKLKVNLKKLLTTLKSVNSNNRILSNRAKRSVNEVLEIFTSGSRHVCNVTV